MKSFFEEGYDSDIQKGLFYETGVSDDIFVAMDEDESVSELVIPPVVTTVPEMSRELAQMKKNVNRKGDCQGIKRRYY